MKLIIHANIHDQIDTNKVRHLLGRALKGDIYLMQESRNFIPTCEEENEFFFNVAGVKWSGKTKYLNGIETSNEPQRNALFISALYDTVCSESGTFKSHGGNRAKLIFLNFIIVAYFNRSVLNLFEMKQYVNEPFFEKLAVFFSHVGKIENNDLTTELAALRAKEAANKVGGFPGDVTFEFVKDYCEKLISVLSPDEKEDQFIIRNTILDREIKIADNLNELIKYVTLAQEQKESKNEICDFPKEIHVIIGAAHLMPYLTKQQLDELDVDESFMNYHENIRSKRLMDFLQVELLEELKVDIIHTSKVQELECLP